MYKSIISIIIGLAVFTLLTFSAASHAAEKKVTVGSKNFTEEYIIGQMMAQLLRHHGFDVKLASDLSSMALRSGMKSGDIDICADYTGSVYMVYLQHKYQEGTTGYALYEKLKKEDANNGFVWLAPIWNNNTYALASWPEFVKKHNLSDLSSLAKFYRGKNGKIQTYVDFEFSVRPDGLPALEKAYNFKIKESFLKTGSAGTSVIALKNHETEVAMVFATDAVINENNWHVYRDNKHMFPPYDLVPYVRKTVLDKYPEIKKIMNSLVATFPGGGQRPTPEIVEECQKVWQKLNGAVDIHKKDPGTVAREYLKEKGLM